MAQDHAKPKTTAQPVVTATLDNALWQKVTPETAAQVSGGLYSGYVISTG